MFARSMFVACLAAMCGALSGAVAPASPAAPVPARTPAPAVAPAVAPASAAPAAAPAPAAPVGLNLRQTVTVDVVRKTKDAVVYISTTKIVRTSPFGNDPFWQQFNFGDMGQNVAVH